jgi:hypothetical protein
VTRTTRTLGRPRKLDWDEVRRVYAIIGTYYGTAKHFGVSDPSIRYIIDAEFRERKAQEQRERKAWVGVCVDCGAPATKTQGYAHRAGRCMACAAKHLAARVRPDALRCSLCQQWLPDEAFGPRPNRIQRRGRHPECRPCQAVRKRDERRFQGEAYLAYERARKARERQARRAAPNPTEEAT